MGMRFCAQCKGTNVKLYSTGSAAKRYPDIHFRGQTPHDAYLDSTAQRVKTLASQILKKCQDYLISQQVSV